MRQLGERLGPPADRDHSRALSDQRLDDPSPNAGSPAGHQCDFACETTHWTVSASAARSIGSFIGSSEITGACLQAGVPRRPRNLDVGNVQERCDAGYCVHRARFAEMSGRDHSAHGSEEAPQVLDEQLGLLHGGEVAAARHVGPVRHVVAPLDPGAREADHLLRIARDAGREPPTYSGAPCPVPRAGAPSTAAPRR